MMRKGVCPAAFAAIVFIVPSAHDARAEMGSPPPPAQEVAPKFPEGDALPPLDLRGYRLTFEDRFRKSSVTADGGAGPWFAPVHADFGGTHFSEPKPDGPFFKSRRGLTIRAEQKEGVWRTGLMQTVDSHGRGFAQTYGYFEIRCELPADESAWPAFWLLTQAVYDDPTATRGEIDVLERPSHFPLASWNAVHITPPGVRRMSRSTKISFPAMAKGYHRYGVLIGREWITFYFDRKPVSHYPTLPVYRTPMYMLVNLATHKDIPPREGEPFEMHVDYVRAYARDDMKAAPKDGAHASAISP